MSKTLYLHIGMGRCGSSAIQHFAAQNRDELLQRGVCYPDGKDFGFDVAAAGNGLPIARHETASKALPAIRKFILESAAERFLLSSEHLYPSSVANFEQIKREFSDNSIQVRCIAYVREQREWMISRYAQALKSKRWKIQLEDYLRSQYNNSNLDYTKRFSGLSQVFGDDLIIHLFRRDTLTGGDVRSDLFDLVGIDVADLIKDQPTTNASPSVLEMEIMRTINTVAADRPFNHRLFLRRCETFFETNDWKVSHDAYRLAPAALMREIKQYYGPKNAEFQQRYFPGVQGDLFSSKIPDVYEVFSADERLNEKSIALLLNYFLQPDRGAALERRSVKPPRKVRSWFGLGTSAQPDNLES